MEEYHNKNDEEGNVLFVHGLLFLNKYAREAASGEPSRYMLFRYYIFL